MKILVCGGRNYGHVVRTKATTAEEPPETQEKLKEYQYIHNVLHHAIMAYSQERNDDDNWLPTDITIIDGGATGADSAASDFSVVNYCELREFYADWKRHGKAAGPIRNKLMLDMGKPDLVIAFPGGAGTENMIAQAWIAGVKVIKCDGTTIPTFERQ